MKKGDFIRIGYVGRLESGEIFDTTDAETAKKEGVYSERAKYRPVPVIVGAGFLIPGLDSAVESMGVGEKKSVEIRPEEGFGQRDPKLVRVVPKKFFEGKLDPKPGMIVDFSGMKGRIQSVEAGRIMVDFNNPLAGKLLKYDVHVIEEINEPAEKAGAVLEFFGIEKPGVSIEGSEATVKAAVPGQLRGRISSLILAHIEGLESVSFVDKYQKNPDSTPNETGLAR